MIDPTKRDIHRTVYTRVYHKEGAGIVGKWAEGKIDAVGRMLVVVDFKGETRDVCRSDLEWTVP